MKFNANRLETLNQGVSLRRALALLPSALSQTVPVESVLSASKLAEKLELLPIFSRARIGLSFDKEGPAGIPGERQVADAAHGNHTGDRADILV